MIGRNRKIYFIILCTLVCLVCSMSIAYAVLSTTLNINGTAQVMDASWNVYFDNVQVNPGSVSINPIITDNDKVSFSADLTTPGQFYKFTVDIVNSGSIDAMIETVIKNPELTTEQKKYIKYEVEYVDGASINETQLLKANETRTISVFVSYRNDIPISDLPSTETDLDLEIRLVYVQATSLGTEISSNQKLVRVVSGNINTIGSEIAIGDEYFYLVGTKDNKAILLTKYNLYVGGVYNSGWTQYGDEATGLQDPTMIGYGTTPRNGTIAFSTSNYWDDGNLKSEYGISYPAYAYDSNSNLYVHVENYKNYLVSLGAEIINGRLISYDELVELGCIYEGDGCKSSNKPWVYSTSYWTGSVTSQGGIFVKKGGNFNYNSFTSTMSFGLRPVIEIDIIHF